MIIAKTSQFVKMASEKEFIGPYSSNKRPYRMDLEDFGLKRIVAVSQELPSGREKIGTRRRANAECGARQSPGRVRNDAVRSLDDDVCDHAPLSALSYMVRAPGGRLGRTLNRSPLLSRAKVPITKSSARRSGPKTTNTASSVLFVS